MQAAVAMAEAIARRRWGIVYGGASVGLMGAVADTGMRAGAEVIGVIPEALVAKEVAHGALTRLVVVPTMHERKATMAELSDAFLALPGGYGTFDELFETVTWSQLGLHDKPIALLDTDGYFDPLMAMVDRGIEDGFIPADQRALLIVEKEPEKLLDAMVAWERPALGPKWIDAKDT